MSVSTFKVLFYLRANYLNKSGKAGIMIRVTVNGELSQFSSKLDIEPDRWDVKNGRAKGNNIESKRLNELLENIRTAINNHYHEIEHRESFVNAEKVRNAFWVSIHGNKHYWNCSVNTTMM